MKILVTGANGYLGQGIVKHLLEKGQEVVAADIRLDHVDERAVKKECDLFAVEDPFDYFEQPDVLLHLAWRNGFVHYADTHVEDLPNHYRFIKAFAESDIKMISAMGTMHEVGFFEGSINENTPCNPTTPYGISKNSLRMLTDELCKKSGKSYQWLRGYYIVGNSKFGNSIFSKITAAEEKGDKTFPFTTGQSQYDFIDYEDFCEQIACSVSQFDVQGIINICSGYPEKLADRVERFIKDNNYSIKLEYGAYPDRPYDSKAIWGDSTKIERITGVKR